MPISLRIPPKKEELINRAAKKEGKIKTAFILDAVYEKLPRTGLRISAQRSSKMAQRWLRSTSNLNRRRLRSGPIGSIRA